MAVEMLAGKPALEGDDVSALSAASADPERRPTPRHHGVSVSDGVEAVFAKALAVDPAARHTRAGELWAAFEAALDSMMSSPEWQTPSPSMVDVAPRRKRTSAKRAPKRSRFFAFAGGALALVALTAIALVALRPSGSAQPGAKRTDH